MKSIEPIIAQKANWWLNTMNLNYKMEQDSANPEIGKALRDYESKSWWKGWNRPDAQLLITDTKGNHYPILIEYKWYKDKLVKLDKDNTVENITSKNEPNFKNISWYAVNGAVHYANALLQYTTFSDIIAIGITGYEDASWNIQHSIWVYFVSKTNYWKGQKIWDFTDLTFLSSENFDDFIEDIKKLNLSPEEREILKQQREREIDDSLKKLHQDIYENEKGLDSNDRIYLISASIIANMWDKPLEKHHLKSSDEKRNRDWDIMMRKIENVLDNKKIPQDKIDLIINTLSQTVLSANINKVENWETQLKRIFTNIIDDLWLYYNIWLTTDFTGKLFNEIYKWIPLPDDKKNDVVLTPSYISTLLVKLARVNKDSYVWDFATGSAWLLVAAMNEMLINAKENIKSPEKLKQKEVEIKANQLLGLELLPSVYMLAILNMILMWDWSSNLLNLDSLKDFNWNYWFWNTDEKFPADAFILNPPYSAPGKWIVFVEKALNMMNKWYWAIIIQNSAGSGQAKDYNKRILENHTLMASIKMPKDIFIWKAAVQTNIYVFKVWEKHHKEEMVKFIDFSNDWYTRASKKKAKANTNLRDTDNVKGRYEELVKLVKFWKSKLNIFTKKEYYENIIDPKNGADWNQSAPIDTKPKLSDFEKTVSDYLSWEVSSLLKNNQEDWSLGK